MATFQPPPTFADPVIVDEKSGKSRFNPIWLKWFVDMVGIINESGGVAGVQHNDTGGLQGGTTNEYYHLTAAMHALAVLILAGGLRPPTTAGAAQTNLKITAGNGVPDNAEGANNDFYFRGDGTKAGNTVIYHKEGGAWVALVTA